MNHVERFQLLQRLRARESVTAAEQYIENDLKYEHYIESVQKQRRQISKLSLKRAIARSAEIGDAMMAVLSEYYQHRMRESELKIQALDRENFRLRTIIEVQRNRFEGGTDIQIKEERATIDGDEETLNLIPPEIAEFCWFPAVSVAVHSHFLFLAQSLAANRWAVGRRRRFGIGESV